jgi:hypothetical protein
VLAGLKFPDPQMLALLGGSKVMIESPLIREERAGALRVAVVNLLKAHFAKVPAEVRRLLGEIRDEERLQKLIVLASRSESMEAFREQLLG